MKFTDKQRNFLKDNETEILGFIGGFGSGKTYAACYKGLQLACRNFDTAGMLVSPTFPMMRDTTRRTFFEVLEKENVSFTFRATENRVIIQESNSEIWFRSADDPNKLKGSNLAWVGLDEASQMDKDAFIIALSRIRDPKAKAKQLFITTTPEGFNWVHEEFIEKPSETKKLIQASTKENTFLDERYVNALLDNYDEKLIEQYVDGKFVLTNSGRVYYSFDRDGNIKAMEYEEKFPLILAVDFNVSPMKWAIIQKIGDSDYIIDELVKKDTSTEEMAREVLARYGNRQYTVYGDYSGTARQTSSRTTDYEIIKQILPGADLHVQPNPLVVDRINAMNARLKNAKGERKLFINPKCRHLIKDLEQVIWKEGKREIDKSNIELTHISDAIGYYIAHKYSLKGRPDVTHRMGAS